MIVCNVVVYVLCWLCATQHTTTARHTTQHTLPLHHHATHTTMTSPHNTHYHHTTHDTLPSHHNARHTTITSPRNTTHTTTTPHTTQDTPPSHHHAKHITMIWPHKTHYHHSRGVCLCLLVAWWGSLTCATCAHWHVQRCVTWLIDVCNEPRQWHVNWHVRRATNV